MVSYTYSFYMLKGIVMFICDEMCGGLMLYKVIDPNLMFLPYIYIYREETSNSDQ